MRVVTLAMGILVLLIGATALAEQKPLPVEVTNLPVGESGAQLLGFTVSAVSARTGIFPLTQACRTEFPASHVCTSEEIVETTTTPGGASGFAWVRPVLESAYFGSTDRYSGLSINGPMEFTCKGWSENGVSGLAVSATGAFAHKSCGDPLPVACCGVPQ
jgi:hypothetical protein